MKFMVIFALFFLVQSFAFANENTFGKVTRALNQAETNGVDLLYNVEIIQKDGDKMKVVNLSLTAWELKPIVTYLAAGKPEGLNGKSFADNTEDPTEAIEVLRRKAVYKRKLTDDEFIQELAEGLVSGKDGHCPITSEIIMNGAQRIYEIMSNIAFKKAPNDQSWCPKLNSHFFNTFSQRISTLSEGKMSLTVAESKELHDTIVNGCPGEYLFLNSGGAPIAKFHLSVTGQGLVCSNDAKDFHLNAERAQTQGSIQNSGGTTR